MTVRVDDLDRKILAELQRDAGQSLDDIARKVGSSKTPVWNRVKKLREAGVIKQQTVLLDAEALGFHVVRKESDEDFGPEQHRRAMKKFDRHDLPVRLVGFYSRMHGGVFTHRGEPLHLHAVMPSDDGSTISGHVESVSLQAGATIKLPKMSP